MKGKLTEAIEDFRYLLSRGYNREGCVKFVGDKYQLGRKERLLLYRAVYDQKSAKKHQKKILPINAIRGEKLAIDGYNVLITVESMLTDKRLILCDDQFVRDVSAVHGKHKPTENTHKAIKLILDLLTELEPLEVVFFYDAQVSLSGELAARTRKMLKEKGIHGDAKTATHADVYALKYSEIVASSDAVLIEKAERLVDLAGKIVKRDAAERLVKLTEI